MRDDDFDKQVDLDPAEWSRDGKYEPFFGPEGKGFLILFLLGFPVSAVATRIIAGEWPLWLLSLLQ